jgi:hypothetical protein
MDHSDDDESGVTLLGGGKWIELPKNRWRKWKTALSCIGVIIILVCIGAVTYISVSVHGIQHSLHLSPTGEELGDCGLSHTVEDARARGCVFDPMSWLWVRPECYEQELIDDFMNRTEWLWHTDWRLTPESEVPLEAVIILNFSPRRSITRSIALICGKKCIGHCSNTAQLIAI